MRVKPERVLRARAVRPLDAVIALSCLLAAALSAIHFCAGTSRVQGGSSAFIEVDGQTVCSLRLDPREPDTLFELALPRGKGTVELREGKVRMLPMPDSVCPLHICSGTGWIGRRGQFIACVPNRLLISVRGGSPRADTLDARTY